MQPDALHAGLANILANIDPSEETDMEALDLRGLVPAPVTPFTRDGEVDHAAIQRLGSWLGSFNGVKGLVVLGHAGEGTFLTADEQAATIRASSSRSTAGFR
jgi:4-hydroxy-tetrahydrodipicolinate synthase